MTKTSFLSQLAQRLQVLPEEERREALEYYNNYLSDAEDEYAAIAELGTPAEVAANILADFVSKPPPKKSRARHLWLVLLAVFALPIGGPLLIAVGAVAFAMVITLFALVVAGGALVVSGIISLLTFPLVATQDFGFALLSSGTGLVFIGIGILLVKNIPALSGVFSHMARFVGQKVRRQSHG